MSENKAISTIDGFNTENCFPDSFWNRTAPLGKHDLVKISEDGLLQSSQQLIQAPAAELRRYYAMPALPFFTLHLTDMAEDGSEFKYDYEPLPKPIADEVNSDGVICDLNIVCRMAFRWDGHPEWQPLLGMILGGITDPKNNCREPNTKLEWLWDGDSSGFDLTDFVERQMDLAFSYYLRVQALLHNRPEVFTESAATRALDANRAKRKKGNPSQRKVRAYRVLTADIGKIMELIIGSAGKRTFSCPNWGVIGHIRRYKSGKEVWIKPYAKGKHRNKSELYSSKKYELAQEALS